MELIRIGDKIIDPQKVNKLISKIIALRSGGSTQADVAFQLGVERTFISHLEALGRIRSGKRVALVGFPIKNCDSIEEIARKHGVEYTFLLSENGRQDFAQTGNAVAMFNKILEVVAELRLFDTVIFLGSDKRIELVREILGRKVIGLQIGKSPITEDIEVDISKLEAIIASLSLEGKGGREVGSIRGSKRKPWLLKKRSQRRSRALGEET